MELLNEMRMSNQTKSEPMSQEITPQSPVEEINFNEQPRKVITQSGELLEKDFEVQIQALGVFSRKSITVPTPKSLVLEPLPGTVQCQIDDCKDVAVKHCDFKIRFLKKTLFEGCGKRACMRHMKFKLKNTTNLHDTSTVEGYHCSKEDCTKSYEKAQMSQFLYKFSIFGSIGCVLLIVFSVLRAKMDSKIP